MATSQKRATPRTAGTSTAKAAASPSTTKSTSGTSKTGAAKVKAPRKTTTAAKSATSKAPRKAVAKTAVKAPDRFGLKSPARKSAAAAAKKAARKAVPGTGVVKKAPAKALVAKAPKLATPRSKRVPAEPDVLERLQGIVRTALEDLKARDIVEIDVRGKTSVTDILYIVSGTSTRHVKSISDEVVRAAKLAGLPPIGVEGQREAEWVLVDLGDVVVHVLLPRARDFYGLERLWTVGDEGFETLLAD